MKCMMSLWTAPSGWEHEGMADLWRLSVTRSRALFAEVVLNTDATGAAWARAAALPFTRIEQGLEALPRDPRLPWSLGKVATYAALREPMLHIDGDAWLNQMPPAHFMAAAVGFEQAERWCPCAGGVANPALLEWDLPPNWRRELLACNPLSYNFGVVVVNDHAIFARAAEVALEVALRNRDAVVVEPGIAACFVEQWGITRALDPWSVATLLPSGPLAAHAAGANYRHLAGALKRAPEWRRAVQRAVADLTI